MVLQLSLMVLDNLEIWMVLCCQFCKKL